ncbi:heparan-alpha-glucosaminide N-acetyltransferase domain-containing protein [Microbacterium lacticum]
MRPVGVAALNAPARVQGVDLARGLAVLGMLAAHLLTIESFDPTRPETWIDIANGRSSILFATLAGVSIALLSAEPGSGGTRPQTGPALSLTRRRLVVRAVLIWLLGAALITTGVPVYVILPAYALLFLFGATLLTLRTPTLWITAAALAVVMPWVQPVLDALPMWQGESGSDLAALVGWHYPFPLWAAFLLAGMAAGRSDLRSVRTDLGLLLGGLAAVVVAGIGASVTTRALAAAPEGGPLGGYLQTVLTDAAHSGGLWEVIGSGGGALATLGACVLVGRTPVSAVLLPLRAVGSMPLTAYVGQICVWALWAAAVLGDTGDLGGFRALDPFWPFALGTILACTAWALLWGRGPLERIVATLTRLLVPR